MEFGLSGAIQLASRLQTNSRAGRRPASTAASCKPVCDQVRVIPICNRSETKRSARESVADLLATC